MQYRLSTLLLAFVVVWSSLAVFGMEWGVSVAAVLLAVAAYIRSAPSMRQALIYVLAAILCGLCVVGLLAWVQEVQDVGPRRRVTCVNNLKQIGLALCNYESVTGRFPPAVVADKQGNAMHSWRLLILPYLEFGTMYSACNLRQPWNGPTNSKFAAMSVPVFCCPADPSINGQPVTSYVAVTGPGTGWDRWSPTGRPLRAMVVEVANSNIPWMKPKDLTLEEACRRVGDGTGPRISGHHSISGGFFFQDEMVTHVLASDASVWSIPANLPSATLRGLFTGDEKAWRVCEEFEMAPPRRINWTNCTALAVLILSYGVLLFRPRDKVLRAVHPASPSPPAATGGN